MVPFEPYVVRLHGECDVARYPEIRESLMAVPNGAKAILLDLSETTLMDSVCLAELLMAKDRWERNGAAVASLVRHVGVLRMLAIANLTEKLRVYGSEDAALRYLKLNAGSSATGAL